MTPEEVRHAARVLASLAADARATLNQLEQRCDSIEDAILDLRADARDATVRAE